MSSFKKHSFVVLAAINASLGIVHYAYVFVVFNSAQKLIQEHIFPNISTTALSFIASSPFIGGLIGAAVTESIGKKLGRRSTLIFADIISIIGTGLTMAINLPLTIIGRALTGVTAGISTVLTNIYIAEISKEPLKGQLGMIPNIAFSIGPILSYLIGSYVPYFTENDMAKTGYRVLLGMPAVISLIKIFNFLVFFKFETPFYLVSQMKEREAESVLVQISDEDHNERLEEIIQERDFIFEKEMLTIRDLFRKRYRKAFFVSLILYISPFTTGTVVPLTFSNLIFSEGTSPDSTLPTLLTNFVGAFNFIGAVGALFLVQYWGRRSLAFLGYIIIMLLNFAISVTGFADSISNMAVKILLLVWIFVCAVSVRPLSYSYPAETLPEIGVGIVVTTKWIAGFVVVQIFLPLKELIWYTGIYLIFTGFAVLAVVVVFFYMIETKGKSKLEALRLYGNWERGNEENLIEKDVHL